MQTPAAALPVISAASRHWILAAFGLALVLMAVAGWLGYQQSLRASVGFDLVNHTRLVQQRAVELEAALTLAETEHRAFLVSAAPTYLVSRDKYLADSAHVLTALRSLTRDNAGQQSRLDLIQRLLDERGARMRKTTELAQRDGIEAARAQFNPTGQGSIRPLHAAIAELGHEESRLLELRTQEAEIRARQLRWLLLLGPGLGIVLLGIGLNALLGQLRLSEQIGRQLSQANAEARHALDLVDSSQDGVFVYDADTLRISYANLGAAEQVGYTRSELLDMSAIDIQPELDESAFRRLLEPLRTGAVSTLSYETRHRHRDGRELPVEVSVRYTTLSGNRPNLVTIARDVSARKQAEDERDLFFTLSLDMLCIASGDGYFKRISPAFTRTLGWSVEELLARPFLDFVHPDDQDATLAEVDRQVKAGQPVLQFDNRYRHKDGTWRVLSWKSAPQQDGRMYATARDVTERKQAEQRIIDLNRELTERQTELQSANRELEAFSYSVSHDLRAPLRHVDGYARMLIEDIGDQLEAEPRRHLQAITESARRMGQLIDDLLDFARLSRKAMDPHEIDMQALARETLADLPMPEGTVSIGPLPAARGDLVLLRQLWANLLSNAFKYSAPRGVEAHIEVSGERRGDVVAYTVRDNGVGFDMRYADKLFGVFQRLHSSDQFEGTGVGLAIVQRILQRHGGKISAQGAPDQGASFTFELPNRETPS